MNDHIRWFETLTLEDIPLVGGKCASLGEMYRSLTPLGIRAPDSSATTPAAYRQVPNNADAWQPLPDLLAGLGDAGQRQAAVAARARKLACGAGLPGALAADIKAAYARLKGQYG